jgi:predicted GIY-YIG superfamily endonuclease
MMKPVSNAQKTDTSISPQKSRKNDEVRSKFYVYVLKLEKGELYVGDTRELKERLIELKKGMPRSTTEEHPKLRYFEILPSSDAAKIREYELKHILKYNRPGLIRLITEFQSLISQVDFD